MAEKKYAPRRLELPDLVELLVREHAAMRAELLKAREASIAGDFESALLALRLVDSTFRQHIADEESQVLRILIGEFGVKGAEQEIRVFQQHRPIHQLMEQVAALASKTAPELAREHTKLAALFDGHTSAEEGHVFPRALSCIKSSEDSSSAAP